MKRFWSIALVPGLVACLSASPALADGEQEGQEQEQGQQDEQRQAEGQQDEQGQAEGQQDEQRQAEGQEKGQVGQQAPADMKAKDIYGHEHDLAEARKRGRVVVLEWFDIDNLPESQPLTDTAKKFQGEQGVLWYGVYSPKGQEGQEGQAQQGEEDQQGMAQRGQLSDEERKKLQDTVLTYEVSYPVLIDEQSKIAEELGIEEGRRVVIIDREGVITFNAEPEKQREQGQQARGEAMPDEDVSRAIEESMRAEERPGSLPAGAPREDRERGEQQKDEGGESGQEEGDSSEGQQGQDEQQKD